MVTLGKIAIRAEASIIGFTVHQIKVRSKKIRIHGNM